MGRARLPTMGQGGGCPPLLAEGRLCLRSRRPSEHRFPSGRCPDSRPQSAHPQPHGVSQAPSSSPAIHHLCFSYGCAFYPSRQDCRPVPPLPLTHSPVPSLLSPWVLQILPVRPLGPLTPSPPLSSHCSCLRSSGWVEQWLRAQPLGQSLASIPRLPLTGW